MNPLENDALIGSVSIEIAARVAAQIDNIASPIAAVNIDHPTTAVLCDSAAIAPGPARSAELAGDDFPAPYQGNISA